MIRPLSLATTLAAAVPLLWAQAPQTYRQPPQSLMSLVDAENPPMPFADAQGRTLALVTRPAFTSLADLSQPELRLAGLRINPRTHAPARVNPFSGVAFQDVATGRPIPVTGLPSPLRFQFPSFSPDGRTFVFVEQQAEGLALWAVDLASGHARRLTEARLSATLGIPFVWAPGGRSLYVRMRPDLAPFPETTTLPKGPNVQDAAGVKAPARTLQDLLKNPADEERFTFFATVAIHRVDLDGGTTPVLPPAMVRELQISPDGAHLLVTELHRPFSYTLQLDRFPYRTRVVAPTGALEAELVDKPLQDRIPLDFDAVEDGRRDFAWREDAPATVVFAQALDGGDPGRPAPLRDSVHQLPAPFKGEPQLLWQTPNRFSGVIWGNAGNAVFADGWWKTRRARLSLVNPAAPGGGKVLFDLSSEDAYGDPGHFVQTHNAFNRPVLRFSADGKRLFLQGEGCSAEGNRPFLDSFDLATGKTSRLWRADGKATYERIFKVLDPEKGRLLTQVEGPRTLPNVFLRTFGRKESLAPLTTSANPFQALDGVRKEIIKYKRADGVELSATLLLPPGYDAARDGKLPVLMDAYPQEFKDAATAGQLRESPHRFNRPYWASPVYWTLRGYAVVEDTQFPIIGQGKAEPNDTYIEQLVADAKAVIDELDRRGVGDPRRVACVGHSYGAFMVANLLAHSDLFAAGIARSGAYNRTLTPFGFQAEERTYWQAPELYHRMSPFDHADKIKSPILLIHGEADNNPGTFTLQSERLFQAIKGLGGRARLVLLPMESHSYSARENILHMIWEQDSWLETHVKNRK